MVYIVDSDFCHSGFELSKKRNILFTAMTRSRCWVRVYGVGESMNALRAELDEVKKNQYELSFHYPDPEQIKRMAHVHRDMSDRERREWEKKFGAAGDIIRAVLAGELSIESLPCSGQGFSGQWVDVHSPRHAASFLQRS